MRRGKLPTIFTTNQLIDIFDTCERPKLSIVIWLGFFCGLRIREACRLMVSDINLNERKIFIRDSKNPNRTREGYGKDRVVRIPPIAIEPMKKWLDIIGSSKWFIPSMQDPNNHIRTKTIHEEFRELLTECGFSEKEHETKYKAVNWGEKKEIVKSTYKYRFHTLRHTYATYLLDKGVPLENIQRSLGHQDLDTTLIYARVSDKKTGQYVDEAFSTPLAIVKKEPVSHPQNPNYNYTQNNAFIKNESPIEILQRRFARGDIDSLTYQTTLQQLTVTK